MENRNIFDQLNNFLLLEKKHWEKISLHMEFYIFKIISSGYTQRSHYLCQIFLHDLDEIGHGKIHDIVPPGSFQDNIWP